MRFPSSYSRSKAGSPQPRDSDVLQEERLSVQELARLIVKVSVSFGIDVAGDNFLGDVKEKLRSYVPGSFVDQLLTWSRLTVKDKKSRVAIYRLCSRRWSELQEALALEVGTLSRLGAVPATENVADCVKSEGTIQLSLGVFNNLHEGNELGIRALLDAVAADSRLPKQCTPLQERKDPPTGRFLRYYVNCRHRGCFRMVVQVMVPVSSGELSDYNPRTTVEYKYSQLPIPHKMEKPRHLKGEARDSFRELAKGKGASVLHEQMEAKAYRGEVPQYSVPTINAVRNALNEDVPEAIREAGRSSVPNLIKYYEANKVDYIWSYEPGERLSVAFGLEEQLDLFKDHSDGCLRIDATGGVVKRPNVKEVVSQSFESSEEEGGDMKEDPKREESRADKEKVEQNRQNQQECDTKKYPPIFLYSAVCQNPADDGEAVSLQENVTCWRFNISTEVMAPVMVNN